VIVVKEGETSAEATSPVLEKDAEKLQKLGSILSTLLENLERIRKMKRT